MLDDLKGIGARVYLFGSQARGDTKFNSDIDIAVESTDRSLNRRLAEIADKLEEAVVVRHVDLVDLNSASDSVRESIRNEGILWRG